MAKFFGKGEIVSLVRVSSSEMIIGAFGSVQTTQITKRIDFNTQKNNLTVSFCSGIVGIALAFCRVGVLALVALGYPNVCGKPDNQTDAQERYSGTQL